MTINKKRNGKISRLLLFVVAIAGLTLGLTTVFAFTDNSNPVPDEFVDLYIDAEGKCGDDNGETTDSGHEMSKEDGKCGEGKCGDGKDAEKKSDHKCGDGKCGDGKDAEEKSDHKCGEGKCGDGKKTEMKVDSHGSTEDDKEDNN
jgi:uncharacterized low-complexity protein